MRKTIIVIFILILILLGCSKVQNNDASNNEIMLGFIGPLSGELSWLGEGNKIAVEIAVDEINKNGGINGRKLLFKYEDGKCNPKDAINAGNKLINIDNIDFIIGGICSGETLALRSLVEQNKVILITPTSSSPEITNSGDYIFRNYVSDNDQGKILANQLLNDGFKEIALLYSKTDWSLGIKNVFIEEYVNNGGKVVIQESFEQGAKDLRSELTKIKNSNGKAIVLFEFSDGAVTFFKQKKELDINLPVYGGDVFSDPTLINNLGELFDGTTYVYFSNNASNIFINKIKSKTNKTTAVPGSVNSYDIVYILANAINDVGNNSTKVKNWLYEMPQYVGESGLIEFDDNGDLKNPKFDIIKVVNGQNIIVK